MNSTPLSELMQQFHAAMILQDGVELERTCDICGAKVQRIRERCADCRTRMAQQDRKLQLGCAYASLPAMPWAERGGAYEQQCNPVVIAAMGRWTRAKGNLVVVGPTGCGKTSAAVARIRAILSRALQGADRASFEFAAGIRFTTASEIAIARKRWPLGDGEAPEVEDAITATLLVLDELGYESQGDTAVPEIIDARYRKGKLTIATSGQTRDGLVARYGDATVRKLVAAGQLVDAFEVSR